MIDPAQFDEKLKATDHKSVRSAALVRLAVMVPIFAALIWVSVGFLPKLGYTPGIGALAVFAIPGALALVSLAELITGIPYKKLAASWDTLKGWQRGILGLLIVAIFTAVLFMAIVGLIFVQK